MAMVLLVMAMASRGGRRCSERWRSDTVLLLLLLLLQAQGRERREEQVVWIHVHAVCLWVVSATHAEQQPPTRSITNRSTKRMNEEKSERREKWR